MHAQVFNGSATARIVDQGNVAQVHAFTPQYAAPEQFDAQINGRTGPCVSLDDRGAQAKYRIIAAFSRIVQFAANLSPVLFLIDDVQWADDATLDLLDELVMRVEDLPLFVVCSTRPELYDRRPHWGEGKSTHHRIDIGTLTRRHIEDMIRDRLRRVRDLPAKFVRTLADRAEGNPLILDETMHLLLDAGVIEVRGDDWSVHEQRLGSLTLPATIQGIVQARLDRLDAPSRMSRPRDAREGSVDDAPAARQAHFQSVVRTSLSVFCDRSQSFDFSSQAFKFRRCNGLIS